VNSASISTSTFKLFKCSSTTSTTCTAQVTGSTDTDSIVANFYPSGVYLDAKSKYKAVITTGVTDEAGNALDQDPSVAGNQEKVWYFTTETK
jgi:hypothetical protein